MTDSVVAQKFPIRTELEEGRKYAWCACGLSKKQPFCDGAHKVGDIRPIVFTAEETKTVSMCCCKQSGKKPYCDGAHDLL